jgi:putative peptide zinc metalloprotease protein
MSKLRGGSASEADSAVLLTYALANFLYAFVVVTVIVMIVGKFLVNLQIGGATIIVLLVLFGYLLVRTVQRFSRISTAYERSVQFDPLARRAMRRREARPAGRDADAADHDLRPHRDRHQPAPAAVPAVPYEAGGNFDIYPSDRQVITTDVAGIVEQ